MFLSPTVLAGWEDESKREDFEEWKKIGEGAFGVVYKVTHKKTKLIYAIKELNKKNLAESKCVDQVKNEIKIMYQLNHENIIKLYNHFEDDINIYLILEFATGGQLYKNMFKQPNKRFNEKTVQHYISELVDSLEYVHSRGIIHRDIKPENILIDGSNNVKLADFGWANFMQTNKKRETYCGTLDYLAPEMIDKSHKHDKGVDIWSVGVLTFELLSGSAPFSPGTDIPAKEIESITKVNIMNVNYSFPSDFPQFAKEFVSKILVKQSDKRLPLADMKKHFWIDSYLKQNPKKKADDTKISTKVQKTEHQNMKELAVFSESEILEITRTDSIINKEFDKADQTKHNFNNKFVQNTSNIVFEPHKTDTGSQKVIEELSTKVKKLEDDLISERARTKSGQGNSSDYVKKLEQDLKNLKIKEEQYINLKKEYDHIWITTNTKDEEIQKLKLELQNLHDDVKKIDSLKAKNKDLSNQIASLKGEKTQLESKNNSLESEIKELTASQNEYKQKYENLLYKQSGKAPEKTGQFSQPFSQTSFQDYSAKFTDDKKKF